MSTQGTNVQILEGFPGYSIKNLSRICSTSVVQETNVEVHEHMGCLCVLLVHGAFLIMTTELVQKL